MRNDSRLATGVKGLDDVLDGGLPTNRIYLVQGDPGSGKTTLGLQFLLEGAARGEECLYVSLSESREEIQAVAHSHGWNLEKLRLHELSALEQSMQLGADNTVFHPAEVELKELIQTLLAVVEQHKPKRVVFDSLSEIRLLSQSAVHYRRQVLQLKQHFAGRQCTVLMLDDRTGPETDQQLQSIAHGVLSLEQLPQSYGNERRRLRVVKLRGLKFRGGYHDFKIETGGIIVYPRLVAAEHPPELPGQPLSSGLAPLDALLGGGLDPSTSTLIMGPAGTGKSSVMMHYAAAAARSGRKAAIYCFDEGKHTLFARARGTGLDIDEQVKSGRLKVRQIDPAEVAPDELAHEIRRAVEVDGCGFIAIDSLNGYLNAMPNEQYLTIQLHELLSYLAHKGVVTVLVMAQHGMLGQSVSRIEVSYVADTVMAVRYFEADGRVRKAISVLKKRSGRHEDTIRELSMGKGGLKVGEPLQGFRGVLTGVPAYGGERAALNETP